MTSLPNPWNSISDKIREYTREENTHFPSDALGSKDATEGKMHVFWQARSDPKALKVLNPKLDPTPVSNAEIAANTVSSIKDKPKKKIPEKV